MSGFTLRDDLFDAPPHFGLDLAKGVAVSGQRGS
jgi:hypothetical protein